MILVHKESTDQRTSTMYRVLMLDASRREAESFRN